MIPNKAYALVEISAEDEIPKCCKCGKNSHYIVNNLFAVCEDHIIAGMEAFDNIVV